MCAFINHKGWDWKMLQWDPKLNLQHPRHSQVPGQASIILALGHQGAKTEGPLGLTGQPVQVDELGIL